ncbi:MAG: aminopeptidase [Candidatus Atabeyarchaeum deiterrae]
MADKKAKLNKRLAEQIVDQCVRVAEGEMVWIASLRDALDLAEAVAVQCDKKGAKPLIAVQSDSYMKQSLMETEVKFLEAPQKQVVEAFNAVDVYIGLGKPALAGVPLERIGAWRRSRKAMSDVMDSRGIRWIGVSYPTEGRAKESRMSLGKFEKAVLNAIDVDYTKISERGKEIIRATSDAKTVHVTSNRGTDITFDATGRKWLNDDGIMDDEDIASKDVGMNLPAGEVFISPIEESANGVAFFDVPTSYFGWGVHNITLTFKDGRVTGFKAEEGEENLRKILESATGDKDMFAEFAMGTNPNATFINDITQDEKVLGTVHMAIGNNKGPAYGGKNDSSIHWDFIMTKPTVEIGGKTILKDGKFLI